MKRGYVQTARAQAARETGERILSAAFDLLRTEAYDDVTLAKVAAEAGVTVQTVIRRFDSKEGVVRAVAESATAAIRAQRGQAPPGDLEAIVAILLEHYETDGDLAMHLLRQESRVAAIAEITSRGKQLHADWCGQVFEPWLAAMPAGDRRRRAAQLVAVCDAYTWYLLRRQQGLSRHETELAFRELLEGLLR